MALPRELSLGSACASQFPAMAFSLLSAAAAANMCRSAPGPDADRAAKAAARSGISRREQGGRSQRRSIRRPIAILFAAAGSALALTRLAGSWQRPVDDLQQHTLGGDAFVAQRGQRQSLAVRDERALLVAREARGAPWKKEKAPRKEVGGKFVELSTHRGTTGRGKKNHFHLLDRYIRRIDALVPEDMEHLVRPLSYKPNMELTTHTLKITFGEENVTTDKFTEEDVFAFFEPDVPLEVAVFCPNGTSAQPEVYAHFAHNDICRSARRHDGELLAGVNATVRYTVDDKWDRVLWKLGRDGEGAGDDMDEAAAEFVAEAVKESPLEEPNVGTDTEEDEKKTAKESLNSVLLG